MGQFDDQISGFSSSARKILNRLEFLSGGTPESVTQVQRAMANITTGARLVNLTDIAKLANRAGLVCQLLGLGLMELDDEVIQRLEESRNRLKTMLRAPLVETDHGAAAWLNRLIESKASPQALADLRTEARVRPGRGKVFKLNGFNVGHQLAGGELHYLILDPVRHILNGCPPLQLLEEVMAFGQVIALRVRDESSLMGSDIMIELLLAATVDRQAILRGLEPEAEMVRLLGSEEIELGPDVASHEGPPGLPLQAPPPNLPPSTRFKKKTDRAKEPQAAELPGEATAPKVEPAPVAEEIQTPSPRAKESARTRMPAGVEAQPKPMPGPDNQVPSETGEPVQESEFLTFRLNKGDFGLPTMEVREIITVPPIARLPRSAAHVLGVINLRGMIVPVVDLRLLLGLKAKTFDKYTVIIVVEKQERLTGLVADNVAEVISLGPEKIQPPPDFTTNASARFVAALAKLEDRLIVLLDLDRLLDRGEIGPVPAGK